MRESFLPVVGTAEAETEKAFLLKPATFDIDGIEKVHSQLWIPKSRIYDGDLDTVSEAIKGEDVEINVAEWWLRQET